MKPTKTLKQNGLEKTGPYSINQLSNITGRDRRTIKKAVTMAHIEPAKVDGKTEFFHLADVENVLKNKPDKSLKDEKLIEDIRKVRLQNDRTEGKLIFKADVAAAVRRILGGVAGILESKLQNEYPDVVAGLDVAQARVYGRRLYDTIMCEFQKLGKEWPE